MTTHACLHKRQRIALDPSGRRVQLCNGCGRTERIGRVCQNDTPRLNTKMTLRKQLLRPNMRGQQDITNVGARNSCLCENTSVEGTYGGVNAKTNVTAFPPLPGSRALIVDTSKGFRNG